MSAQLDFNECQGETMLYRSCQSCDAEIAQESAYCRWCGAQQTELISTLEHTKGLHNDTVVLSKTSPYATTPFENKTGDFAAEGKREVLDFRVSGYLIHSFVESVKSKSSQFQGSFEKAALALLTFIPVCLLIIFLSPLDAYFAAKNFLKG